MSTVVTLSLVANCGQIFVTGTRHGEAWEVRLDDAHRRPLPLSRLVGTEYETIVERLDAAYTALSSGPAVDPPGLVALGQELAS